MSLADVAQETLAVIERGEYLAPSGRRVELRNLIDRAVRGTELYRPEMLAELLAGSQGSPAQQAARIEVTGETTAEAARRLVEMEGEPRVAALNFASARHPGGGFLTGARAQEEDLARASAVYPCLVSQPEYYEVNRASPSPLYTDHAIYSPDVPFFRDQQLALLEAPFQVSIITAPAPNAGEFLRGEPDGRSRVRAALETRTGKVLTVAAAHSHRCLVLGAWGCGVFRNDPDEVADVFGRWLELPVFAGAFDRVVFAIYDRSAEQRIRAAFARRFTAASGEA